MTRELTVNKAIACGSVLLAEVENGEQFVITWRGLPVARQVTAALAAARQSQARSQRLKVAENFTALGLLRAGCLRQRSTAQRAQRAQEALGHLSTSPIDIDCATAPPLEILALALRFGPSS